jgi:molybdenum cofactor biosynthesis enzyme MoaA
MENFQPDHFNNILHTDQLLKIIKSYVKNSGKYVQFTGGEPLLRRDLSLIVSKTFEYGGIPEINTNGIALTPEKAQELKDLGINVIKVSIPSFDKDEYKEITGSDALIKVLGNIKSVKDVVKIRVNVVATKQSMAKIDLAIDKCLEYGIPQLLLLELLFYPHVDGGIDFFKENYVNIIKDFDEYFLNKFGARFENYETDNKFESSLYVTRSKSQNISVYLKRSAPVWRLEECKQCNSFCQEGVYELRISTGGYLNFCNITNEFGEDISKSSEREIDLRFKNLLEILSDTIQENGNVFIEHYKLG